MQSKNYRLVTLYFLITQAFLTMKSSPITCSRRIEFDAAHRVMQHEGKCKHLHGHRYALEATFAASGLDTLGRVVDFAVIKEKLGGWILDNWDHATILYDKDKALGKAISDITGQKIFYMPSNPTAENMAEYMLNDICPALFTGTDVQCVYIKLYETPNCFVETSRL
jgi:6-pyruvoyltetrahydropterin/6-carboxytetrahydropterin synthase